MNAPQLGILVLFPLFFIGLWLFVCFVLAQLGWNRLRDFKTHSEPQGQRLSLQSATVSGVRYKGALSIVLAANGLYLRPVAIFSFGHAPLFIPYGAFGALQTRKAMWGDTSEWTIHNSFGQKVPIVFLSQSLNNALAAKVTEQRGLQSGSLRGSAPPR